MTPLHYERNPSPSKKLQKGDNFWSTQKVILGWLIDTANKTIALPLDLLQSLVHRKRTTVKQWHQLLGVLRSMSLAIPGSCGCFSFLQHALRPGAKRIKITKHVRHQLKDFLWLANDVSSCPTHLAEVVPTPPSYYGAMDAAKSGMGGVWFSPLTNVPLAITPHRSNLLQQPCLWRSPFPDSVQDDLVSFKNPTGSITNSDLELASTIPTSDDILASAVPIEHISTCSLCDNTPAVSWRTKGSTTTVGLAAYLLQLSSLHQRHFRYKPEIHHIVGDKNAMADACSCLWHLSDSELLTHFNLHYPQTQSWTMRHLRPEMNSALISCLHRKRSLPESYLPEIEKGKELGTSGVRFAPPSMSTQTFRRWPTLSLSSKPSDFAGEMDELPPAATLTELARWRTPSGLSVRSFPYWGPRILV